MRFRIRTRFSWSLVFVAAFLAYTEGLIIDLVFHSSGFIPPLASLAVSAASAGYYFWRIRRGVYVVVDAKGIRVGSPLPVFHLPTIPYDRVLSVQLSRSGRATVSFRHQASLLGWRVQDKRIPLLIDRLADPQSFEMALRLYATAPVAVSWLEDEPAARPVAASLLRRVVAFCIDAVVVFGLWYGGCLAIVWLPYLLFDTAFYGGEWVFLVFLAVWFAYTWLSNARGRSLGKWLTNLRVEVRSGGRPGLWRGLRRTFGQLAIGATGGIAYLWVLTNPERRGLHDFLAGTLVVPGVRRQGALPAAGLVAEPQKAGARSLPAL